MDYNKKDMGTETRTLMNTHTHTSTSTHKSTLSDMNKRTRQDTKAKSTSFHLHPKQNVSRPTAVEEPNAMSSASCSRSTTRGFYSGSLHRSVSCVWESC